jgi:hypothetical protein
MLSELGSPFDCLAGAQDKIITCDQLTPLLWQCFEPCDELGRERICGHSLAMLLSKNGGNLKKLILNPYIRVRCRKGEKADLKAQAFVASCELREHDDMRSTRSSRAKSRDVDRAQVSRLRSTQTGMVRPNVIMP